MLTYFPRSFSSRGITCYVITLVLVSALFLSRVLPFQYMLFGLIPVIIFFAYSTQLTMKWQRMSQGAFLKKLFVASLVIRMLCVFIIYFFYLSENGTPFKFGTGDDTFYAEVSTLWHNYGFREAMNSIRDYAEFSDRGYCVWISFEGFLLGTHVLSHRLVKCLIDSLSCVLIYHLGRRNFGESTGRMAAIFYMLMPNMWYYCGVTLKEIEMAFLTILFVERADNVFRSPKITLGNILLPAVIVLVMFTFRTALAAVLIAALAVALLLSSGRQLQSWKKVLYSVALAVWMIMTVGVEMIQETRDLWQGRADNQSVGYEWRAESNSFAKYASASVFAPLIFTIPFSSMVNVVGQENQMIMNGANFIKNIMSGFTILAVVLLFLRGDWRKHVLPLATLLGYLVVLVFSNFAHSERFHFPILGLELLLAAFGVSQVTNRHKRWYNLWTVGICIANVLWALIKLRGRGLA